MSKPVQNMLQLFAPGDVLHGYCNGYFGRDSYRTKTCVMVRPLYAVFEYESCGKVYAETLNFNDRVPTVEEVAAWKIEPEVEP